MSEILTEDRKHVRIFAEGIRIDKTLPKYQIMEANKKEGNNGAELLVSNNLNTQPFSGNVGEVQSLNYDVLKAYFIDQQGVENSNVTDFNISISERMRNITKQTSFYRGTTNSILYASSEKKSLFEKIWVWFSKKKKYLEEKHEHDKFDVIEFFANVKMASEEEAKKYRNRIADFVNCIGMAEKSGQIALKDKLFSELVNHKYESILHAHGLTQLITEKLLVEFCQKAPKALSLDYISNYQRNIPFEIINKKIKIDELEVFDNYVILHYDPDGSSYAKTNAEKKKEVDKAKDPILFGVLSGSNKLYYIDSWEDEYCDLTFDKMTEILGKEIVEKNFLKDKI